MAHLAVYLRSCSFHCPKSYYHQYVVREIRKLPPRQGFSFLVLPQFPSPAFKQSSLTEGEIMATELTKEENGASSKGKWTSNKKRKEKDVFIYGNYKSYYGYRVFFPFHFQLIFIAISPYFSHTVMKQQIESKQMIISLVVRFRVYKKEF